MGRIKEFIADHGLKLMLFGMSAAALGVLLYALLNTPRYAAFYYPHAAVGLFFLGIAVYAVGRVSVGIQQNANKRKARALVSRRDDGESAEPPALPGGGSADATPGNDGESGAK